MFFPKRPGHAQLDRLEALRLSLNAPVVDTAELAQAPARAAIAVFREQAGGPRMLEVRLRPCGGGSVVAYGLQAPLETSLDVVTALDAALSFGESMGFMFGDDAFARRNAPERDRAIQEFAEFVAGPGDPEAEPPELTLEDALDPPSVDEARSQLLGLEPAELSERAGSAPVPQPAAKSKPKPKGRARQRTPAKAPARGASAKSKGAAKTAFGRIQLVRRAGHATPEAGKRLLARLFGAF